MKKSFYRLGILIAICAVFFTWLDIPLMYLFYTGLQGTALAQISHVLAKVFRSTNWLILGIFILGYGIYLHKHTDYKRCGPFIFCGATLVITYIITGIIKVVLARYRPIELITHNLYGFHFFSFNHNFNSTPSGHTIMAFAGLYGLSRIWKKAWLTSLLLIPVILIGISRIIIADHYCSDVILSIYLGIVIVMWMEGLYKNLKHPEWWPVQKAQKD